jgi:geranylgeranyl pyrophosphate synthase
MKGAGGEVDLHVHHHQDRWGTYLRKTYLKTMSLMAKGARAAIVLRGCREGEVWKEAAYAYDRNIAITDPSCPPNHTLVS